MFLFLLLTSLLLQASASEGGGLPAVKCCLSLVVTGRGQGRMMMMRMVMRRILRVRGVCRV